jgi:hypothetical protein
MNIASFSLIYSTTEKNKTLIYLYVRETLYIPLVSVSSLGNRKGE